MKRKESAGEYFRGITDRTGLGVGEGRHQKHPVSCLSRAVLLVTLEVAHQKTYRNVKRDL